MTTLNATPGQPDSGTIVALDSVGSFGSRPVDANGDFMDFDGAEHPSGPDVSDPRDARSGTDGSVAEALLRGRLPGADGLRIRSVPALPYPGYARPKGATPINVPLVPAYEACTSGTNRPTARRSQCPSCNPPTPSRPTT